MQFKLVLRGGVARGRDEVAVLSCFLLCWLILPVAGKLHEILHGARWPVNYTKYYTIGFTVSVFPAEFWPGMAG